MIRDLKKIIREEIENLAHEQKGYATYLEDDEAIVDRINKLVELLPKHFKEHLTPMRVEVEQSYGKNEKKLVAIQGVDFTKEEDIEIVLIASAGSGVEGGPDGLESYDLGLETEWEIYSPNFEVHRSFSESDDFDALKEQFLADMQELRLRN
jgi:hypothetical protein